MGSYIKSAESVDEFGGPSRAGEINFRVPNLEGMIEQLRAGGNEVTVDPATFSMGRFASLTDPDGNPIQLWRPAEG